MFFNFSNFLLFSADCPNNKKNTQTDSIAPSGMRSNFLLRYKSCSYEFCRTASEICRITPNWQRWNDGCSAGIGDMKLVPLKVNNKAGKEDLHPFDPEMHLSPPFQRNQINVTIFPHFPQFTTFWNVIGKFLATGTLFWVLTWFKFKGSFQKLKEKKTPFFT